MNRIAQTSKEVGMNEFSGEGDGFYECDDPKEIQREINNYGIRPGLVVGFSPKSFFASRGGKLIAKVLEVDFQEGASRGHILVKCLPGTDCYLSPGETETFPLEGWQKTLEILNSTTSGEG